MLTPPGIPPPGIVSRRLLQGSAFYTSWSPHLSGGGRVAAVLRPSHVESSCDSTWTQPRLPSHTPRTPLSLSAVLYMSSLPPLASYCSPPQSGCPRPPDRVGLQTNVGKTVSMACHSCRAGAGNRTEAGYSRRLTGVGKTYTERQREKVVCRECWTIITAGSMLSHMMTQHGKAATRWHLWATQTNGGPRIYKMKSPTKDGRRR